MAVYCNSWSKRFQSTFPRGERLYTDMQKLIMFNFNPRSLVGNDRCPVQLLCDQCISIHVPSWGTTGSLFSKAYCSIISIHVPSWGTTIVAAPADQPERFQSTFPRGERLLTCPCFHVAFYFNPRSLVGNDCKEESLCLIQKISIHVPSWGTTGTTRPTYDSKVISIHVPSWGTTTFETSWNSVWIFQSTFPRGERLPRGCCVNIAVEFQSTFPRGERRQIFTNILCFFMQ